jgi:murein DD-endopeptidase MepM/ murein hydrolase activator NlpD
VAEPREATRPAPAKSAEKQATKPAAAKPAAAKPAAAKPVAAITAPAKTTKADDADEAPAKPARKGADARKAEQPKLAKAAPVKEEAPAPVEKRVVRAPEKRETVKIAAAEKPAEAAPAAESSKIDRTPTASIPPAPEKASLGKDGNPEFRWPARGRVIQGFGSAGNDGINISVPEGTQVKAAEGGVVAYAGNELKNYGNLVLIRHDNGFVSAYANNSALEVKRGERVARGQNIAKSGQTGSVGSPQLHFELRKGSTPVDPTSYLAGL